MKTPKHSATSKRGGLANIKIVALSAALGVPAFAVFSQTLWNGGTSDFNNPASWNGTYIGDSNPNCSNDSGSNNVVLIQPGDAIWQHGDTLAGNGANTSGAYLQTGSTNNTGGGNWLRLGLATGSFGAYVLSNGVVNVGGQTHLGEFGAGYLEIDGGTYNTSVTGQNPGFAAGDANDFGDGSVGTFVMTGGVFNNPLETWFGTGNAGRVGTGHFIMHGGIINVNNWFVFGRFGGQADAYMDGGTINKNNNGNMQLAVGNQGAIGAVVTFTQNGGTINCQSEYQIATDNGLTVCTNNVGGTAVINAGNWFAVGRNGGKGTLNLSGSAAISISGLNGGNFTIAGDGGPVVGVINQTGGVITNTATQTWIGETGTGTWNMNGGAAVLGTVEMCVNSSASGVLNLNGGVFQCGEIYSSQPGAVSELNLNGGTLQASANNAAFISGLFQAAIGSGGVTIDSQGYSITIPQTLTDAGGGTLTKAGSGTLTLSAANSYAGTTAVNAGTLATTTAASGSGGYTVANGATLNLQVVGGQNSQLNMSSFTLDSGSTTLGIDLNNFGNPGAAPVNVSGALAVNGTVIINIADALPQVGQFPLISYGSKTGTGYVLGTLPFGVTAALVDDTANNSIDLNITAVNLPRWDGSAGGDWDLDLTANWINIGTGQPTYYLQGNAVLFDDNASGTTTVNLVAAVTPTSVTINNNSLSYTLAGAGSINGGTGIWKAGTGTFAIDNVNGYTGPTTITNGTLSVTNLANGGSPSALGASSANPTNLVLAGGTLAYAGPAVTINRGYSLSGTNQSSINTTSNLTLTGLVATNGTGVFEKDGNGQLAYKSVGNNQLSGADYNARAGSILLDGSAGIQSNNIPGTLSVCGPAGAAATLTNTAVTTGVNVGIGDVANTMGTMEVDTNTTLTVNSWLVLGDGANAVASLTLNGGTINVPNGRLFLCSAPGTMTTLNINGGTINKSGDYFAIVNGGWNGNGARTGVVNQVNGTINCQSECWIGDSGGAGNQSVGIYNLSGGSLNLDSWFGVGRDGSTGFFNMTGGTLYKAAGGDMVIGRGGSHGTFTMSGGTINRDLGNPIIIGQGQGVGEFDISGGTVNDNSEYWLGTDNGTIATNNISGTAQMNVHDWVTIGRNGLGVVNMSSGQFNADTQPFVVGLWAGSQGVWNQSGGSLYVNQDIWIGQGAGATNSYGTVNLTGGTITNTGWLAIGREAGQGILNISGGTMVKAGVGNNISIAHNSGASGQVNISGTGKFLCLSGETWVGENAAPGAWTMNGGTAVLGLVRLAENADAQGVMTLNAGSLTATEITTGNTGASQRELDLNGGTLVAGMDNANFIHDLTAANVQAGGAVIDTAGHTVSVNQALIGVGNDGGLTKNGNGTLYLNGVNTYTNLTQVNAGTLGGQGTIAGSVSVATGAGLAPGTAAIGTLTVNGNLTLAAGSSTVAKFSLDGGVTNNDQVIALGSVSYNGSLVVTNTGSTLLLAGTQFKLFNAAGHSGNFLSVTILPAGAGTFDPATGVLTVTAGGGLRFNPALASAGNLIVSGTGGIADGGYTLLTTTNLAAPRSAWTTNTSGTLDGSGSFTNSIPIIPGRPAAFFQVRQP
jgi:autotransporter-associated beta strand protein